MRRNFGLHCNAVYEQRYSQYKTKVWLRRAKVMFCAVITLAVAAAVLVIAYALASARDDGRFAGSPLKPWFDQLASKKGLCCSFADGVKVEDVDWDTQDGRYRVHLEGQWIVVPDDAVVTEPNRFGPAVVWPYRDRSGDWQSEIKIRCFIPGSGA